jgi:drug/metabolite transporter (DMT)-like permease
MSIPFPGELAALATSFFFALGPMFFTLAGRELGSVIVNRLRLLAATFMLLALHGVMMGTLLPTGASASNWIWLAASGVVGLVIGDSFLFQAFVLIGARLTMLVFGLSPLIASVLAWVFLGEKLGGLQIAGIAVTLAGVSWVISERQVTNGGGSLHVKGLLFALGGAFGQAAGLFLARKGLDGELPALSGHLIRLGSATVTIWIFALLRGSAFATFRALRHRPRGGVYTMSGAVLGPLFGVWLSLIAIRYTSLGIATTLMALPPLFLLPIDRLVFGHKVRARAIWGTILAMAGVAMLFLN